MPNKLEWLTWLSLLEDHLASLKGVVLHAARQVKQLTVAQAEQDGHLAQRLKPPHVLNWAQQAVKGLAHQREANHSCLGCYSCCPAGHIRLLRLKILTVDMRPVHVCVLLPLLPDFSQVTYVHSHAQV